MAKIKNMSCRLTLRKFAGDDSHSWGVFRSSDVKGIRGVVFHGEASPITCGMTRGEAEHVKKTLEKGMRDRGVL